MDPGLRTPLVDSFRRGEVAREMRIEAAQGAFAPRALDQIALLLILVDDADVEIAQTANATLDAIPRETIASFLSRSDVTGEMREWFAARGIVASGEAMDGDEPLVQAEATVDTPAPKAPAVSGVQRLATMSVM